MARRRILIWIIAITGLGIIIVSVGILVTNLSKIKNPPVEPNNSDEIAKSEEKALQWGISGYTPANYPKPSISDFTQFWGDLNSYAQLYGIHISPKDIDQVEVAAKQTDIPLEVLLGSQNPEEWRDYKSTTEVAISLLDKYDQIQFIGYGNEINIAYLEHKKEFTEYLTGLQYFKETIKAEHPDITIFTTVNYEALANNAYLMPSGESSWEVLAQISDEVDLLGITFYPHLKYSDPSEIPTNYLQDLKQRWDKPIGITETGWMSQNSFTGNLAALPKEWNGSEAEQVEYLEVLQELIDEKGINTRFVNWAFLNDYHDWENEQSQLPYFDSIGLRKNDGSEKEVFSKWKLLVAN